MQYKFRKTNNQKRNFKKSLKRPKANERIISMCGWEVQHFQIIENVYLKFYNT